MRRKLWGKQNPPSVVFSRKVSMYSSGVVEEEGGGGRCGRAYTCMTNFSGISSGPHADESPKLKLKQIFLSQHGEPGMWTSRRP